MLHYIRNAYKLVYQANCMDEVRCRSSLTSAQLCKKEDMKQSPSLVSPSYPKVHLASEGSCPLQASLALEQQPLRENYKQRFKMWFISVVMKLTSLYVNIMFDSHQAFKHVFQNVLYLKRLYFGFKKLNISSHQLYISTELSLVDK